LLSFAAWRALFQLLYAPQRWEKTEHGLARTSRVAGAQRSRPERRRNRIDVGPLNIPPRVRIAAPPPIAPLQLMQTALPA
jgi:hypothetical protein